MDKPETHPKWYIHFHLRMNDRTHPIYLYKYKEMIRERMKPNTHDKYIQYVNMFVE